MFDLLKTQMVLKTPLPLTNYNMTTLLLQKNMHNSGFAHKFLAKSNNFQKYQYYLINIRHSL